MIVVVDHALRYGGVVWSWAEAQRLTWALSIRNRPFLKHTFDSSLVSARHENKQW
jgi:hypothetical protein